MKDRLSRMLLWCVLLLALVFYALPIYVMVVNGVKVAQDVSLAEMWAPCPPLWVWGASRRHGACLRRTCATVS